MSDQVLQARLCAMARDSEWLMQALRAVRDLALPSWCIGASAVRNLVWDKLHGYAAPSQLPDVDVGSNRCHRCTPL